MKNILASSMIIAALSSLLIGTTAAVFTDQEVLAGNTVATGTLELTLNHSAGKPFNITNAYPGYSTPWENIDIYNSGNMPFEALMSFDQTSGDTSLYNALVITLETSGGDAICHNGDGQENVIYTGLLQSFTDNMLVSSLNYWHLANEDDASGSPADNIRAGWSERVCQTIGVDENAGNEIMGQTVTFSEIVDAVQDND